MERFPEVSHQQARPGQEPQPAPQHFRGRTHQGSTPASGNPTHPLQPRGSSPPLLLSRPSLANRAPPALAGVDVRSVIDSNVTCDQCQTCVPSYTTRLTPCYPSSSTFGQSLQLTAPISLNHFIWASDSQDIRIGPMILSQ